MTDRRFIYRHGHGWRVSVPEPRGRRVSKFFGDRSHGGKRKAFRAAVRARNKLYKLLWCEPLIPLPKGTRQPRRVAQKNSSTGIVGVRVTTFIYTKRGRRYKTPVAIAQAGSGATVVKRIFSINKYGKTEAVRLAKRARQQLVRRHLK